MSGQRGTGAPAVPDHPTAPVPMVKLACTACQHVYESDLADFGSGNTGCPRCGGWTWIAQLDTATTDVGGGVA
ncbi:MAG: hypothetical protein LC749_17075 [Actinobacteria bacterium]|nr:hypothetical protein [Actinomycetota bacterium]